MGFIDYQASNTILVMTGGHPFNRDDFATVFDGIPDTRACMVEQPAAQAFFRADLASQYDAFVFYDMPGMDFTTAANDGLAPRYVEPPGEFKAQFLDLLIRGHGFVFLHHAIAAWPAWPEYAEIVGGRFLYKPDKVRGERFSDSGYRHAVKHQISVLEDHPVTSGLASNFTIEDELYLSHAFEDNIVPLLRSDYQFEQDNFYSAQQAVQGSMHSRGGWEHSRGHSLVGWVKHYENSPIVYLQCGDSKSAYDNPEFKQLLHNAIQWVASDKSRAWARQRNQAAS